jgi:hypothetical protein
MKAVATTLIASASFVTFLSGYASADIGMAPVVPENLKVPEHKR